MNGTLQRRLTRLTGARIPLPPARGAGLPIQEDSNVADLGIQKPIRTRLLWEKGDFTRIAETMRQSGEDFVDTLGIRPGMKVLDLGCGDGTTALPGSGVRRRRARRRHRREPRRRRQ